MKKLIYLSVPVGALALLLLSLACRSADTSGLPVERTEVVAAAELPSAFLESAACARCHSASPRARALTTSTGADASPYETWRGTLMANAFRDPYWRAQMAHEIEMQPEKKAEIEGLCLTCHAPMVYHDARLAGTELPAFEDLQDSAHAFEGVSCTVCHQTPPEGLGEASSFSGKLGIRDDKKIYGPFENPVPGPMRMHTGYTPTHGEHISESALCGACHTLFTQASPDAQPFLEQAPYLEWRNSDFSTENGSEGQSCQQCHMPDMGDMKIARNLRGFDFATEVRKNVRGHSFVGGNAVMLDMLRENAEALGVTAPAETMERLSRAARAQLAHETARVTLGEASLEDNQLSFDVVIENLTGHKFPTGYPARRAWLDVEVQIDGRVVFESGAFDEEGRLVGVENEGHLPHVDLVTQPSQVPVYEMVAADVEGRPTTSLVAMTHHLKDTRLLPVGWSSTGPHALETHPYGTEGDANFAAGGDKVRYEIALPQDAPGDLILIARMYYQPIPPHWVDGLRDSNTEAAKFFLDAFERLGPQPELVYVDTAVVPR